MNQKLSLKEQIAFRFIFNEKRVYSRWFGRFFVFGIDYGRLHRVVARIKTWFQWCREWSREGDHLADLAGKALDQNHKTTAIALYHEAVACYHIGQHIFFIDARQKEAAQEKARQSYVQAINLYPEKQKPIRVDIPFEGTMIPGYLHLCSRRDQPLVIYLNGMDNLKEAENHFFGQTITGKGINFFTFDGPGQGEMWKTMKFRLDYHKAVTAIIDWLEQNPRFKIDLSRIANLGFSLGGYLAPMTAAHEKRIICSVGNSGFARIGGLKGAKRLNPIWQRGVLHMTGYDNLKEAVDYFDLDITKAPPLRCPLLFFHSGRDEVMPEPKKQADTIMNWAQGEKKLLYYPDAEHCTVNYLDEVFPNIVDWLINQLGVNQSKS